VIFRLNEAAARHPKFFENGEHLRKCSAFPRMNAQLSKTNLSVSAYCPTCQAVTSFDPKFTAAPVPGVYPYKGQTYTRLVNIFGQCPRCSRGGLAVVLDTGNPPAGAVLESFYPVSIDAAPLPSAVPCDIEKEFREAERCAAFGANRALNDATNNKNKKAGLAFTSPA